MNTISDRSPHFSVIIPVYNDPKGIHITLNSLISQSHNDYEILPVDNNSTDNTPAVLSRFAADYPDLIQPLEEPDVQSSYAARNTGVEHASGDVLLFLDADMWVEETWIEDMVTALDEQECDYLGCNVEVVTSENPPLPERYEEALSFPVETYLEDKQFAPTCALEVRREVFEKVGLFDHRLESGGDKEFGQRVHDAGSEQGYAGEITAYHPARDSFGAMFSKARRIGRGRAQKRAYLPAGGGVSHPLHPINFLPPSPWRLKHRYSGVEVSRRSMGAFYLLEYALKLTQSGSTIRETISINRNP